MCTFYISRLYIHVMENTPTSPHPPHPPHQAGKQGTSGRPCGWSVVPTGASLSCFTVAWRFIVHIWVWLKIVDTPNRWFPTRYDHSYGSFGTLILSRCHIGGCNYGKPMRKIWKIYGKLLTVKLASLGLVVSGICISHAVHFAQAITICRPWWPRGRFQVKTEAQRLFSPAVHSGSGAS